MTLREVLREVVVKCDLVDIIDIDAPIIEGEEYDKVLLASNNIIRELASSYLPLLERERVEVKNNRLDLSKLKRQIIKVVSLRCDGTSMHFSMYPTYMYAQNGIYDMVYSYLPKNANIDDEIEVDARVNSDILSNGIASEYYLMTGNFEMGDLYDKKYRENLKNISITRHEIRVKGRAFV